MSLKMRLFKGKKRKELCSMFDNNHLSKTMCLDLSSDSDKENELDVSTSSISKTQYEWSGVETTFLELHPQFYLVPDLIYD